MFTQIASDLATCDKLLTTLMQSPDLVALFDNQDRLQAANQAYCSVYQCDPAKKPFWHEIMRWNYQNNQGPLIETDDIDIWLTDACARRATLPYRAFEVELHDTNWIWVTETMSTDGWMLFHATNISSLSTSKRHLRKERDSARRASWTDPLTGAPNRRYVMTRLDEWHEMQSSQPEFGVHSLAMIDLDNFKALNDQFGHSFGDLVLRSFSQQAVNNIRPLDLFGRIGGEEFIFLMPNCTLQVANERLSQLQQKLILPTHNIKLSMTGYTFSAGLVLVRKDKDIHHAIRHADKLMYRAKHEGRARIFSQK